MVGQNSNLTSYKLKRVSTKTAESLSIVMVPEVGIEPTRSCPRGILSKQGVDSIKCLFLLNPLL